MALINTTTTGILGTTVYGDGAGALTVQKDGVTQGIYGNIPAFEVYAGSQVSLSHNIETVVQLNTKVLDTASCFDTTNYRWTPPVAGYYLITGSIFFRGTAGRQYYFQSILKKNTSTISYTMFSATLGTGGDWATPNSVIVYLNGSTDYVGLNAYHYDYTSAATVNVMSGISTHLSGVLVKAL